MRKFAIIVAGLLAAAGAVTFAASASQASQTATHSGSLVQRNRLSITGSVVAGVTSAQTGQDVVFDFTIKNHGRVAVPGDTVYTVTHGKYVDIVCPLVSTKADINPDTPACEPGDLPPGQSTQSAIILKVPTSSGSLMVTACATEENNAVPPSCAMLTLLKNG